MIIRRRTYSGNTISKNYGYYMINTPGITAQTENVSYRDSNGNYYNPVYRKYGCEEITGTFPSSYMDRSRIRSNNLQPIICLMSYTDGSRIVCLNGTTVYKSDDGGLNWTSLFTLSYTRVNGNINRMLADPIVYFDSNYVYVLFEVSVDATMTYTSWVDLKIAYYSWSSGALSYLLVASYTNRFHISKWGASTFLSPDGFVCRTFTFKTLYQNSMDYYENDFEDTNQVRLSMAYIPGLVNSAQFFREFWLPVNIPYYSYGSGYTNTGGSQVPKWHYDGTTYGCFYIPFHISYYCNSTYNKYTIDQLFKVTIGLSSWNVPSPTVTSVYRTETPEVWEYTSRQVSEHPSKIVSGELMFIKSDSTIKIMNSNNWTVKKELPTLSELLALYEKNFPNDTALQGDNVTLNINITPDGKYYVLTCVLGGHTYFYDRINEVFLSKVRFIGNGNVGYEANLLYMMPRATL